MWKQTASIATSGTSSLNSSGSLLEGAVAHSRHSIYRIISTSCTVSLIFSLSAMVFCVIDDVKYQIIIRYLFPLLMAVLLLAACQKNRFIELIVPTHPLMKHREFHDVEIKVGQNKRFDVDDDGSYDFGFETLLVGDPVLDRDRLLFVGSPGSANTCSTIHRTKHPSFR